MKIIIFCSSDLFKYMCTHYVEIVCVPSYEHRYEGLCSVVLVQIMFKLRDRTEACLTNTIGWHWLSTVIFTAVCLSQGFHRYSTDSSWHVPHFEKMLYDQAQLAVAYITASQVCVCV